MSETRTRAHCMERRAHDHHEWLPNKAAPEVVYVCSGAALAYGPGNPPPENDPPELFVPAELSRVFRSVEVRNPAGSTPELTPQDDLLGALADLLDNALHGPECYIDPDETHCTCLIGKVRGVLPFCEATVTSAESGRVYRCFRIAHPSDPNRHMLG